MSDKCPMLSSDGCWAATKQLMPNVSNAGLLTGSPVLELLALAVGKRTI